MVPIVVIAEPDPVRARYLQDDLLDAGITDLAVNVGGPDEAQSLFEDIVSAIGDDGPLHIVLFISGECHAVPTRRLLRWIRGCAQLTVKVAVLDLRDDLRDRHEETFGEGANAHFVKFPTIESLTAFVFGSAPRSPAGKTTSPREPAGIEADCAVGPPAVCS